MAFSYRLLFYYNTRRLKNPAYNFCEINIINSKKRPSSHSNFPVSFIEYYPLIPSVSAIRSLVRSHWLRP